MAKILLLEDEPEIAETIVETLSALGHTVEHVSNGDDAIAFCEELPYDLCILDVQVPGPDGLEVLKALKKHRPDSKVFMLTSRAAIDNRLKGFALGADDYVPKPFDMRELIARIDAILRRPQAVAPMVLTHKYLQLDKGRRELKKNGVPISLQPQDMKLLEFLMEHPNEVFSGDALLTRVWHLDSNASLQGLRVCIARIRKAIDEHAADSTESVIETVGRVGYKLSV